MGKKRDKAGKREARAGESTVAYAEAAFSQAKAAARAARIAEEAAVQAQALRDAVGGVAASAGFSARPVAEAPAGAAAVGRAGEPGFAPGPAAVAPLAGPGPNVGMVFRSVIDRMRGAQLCYGEPVVTEGRTIIPVSRVTARGGMGFGGPDRDGGGGGGGRMDATPAGFIDVTATGAHFVEIADPHATLRMVRSAASAAGTLVVSVAWARRLRTSRRPRLPRGS